MARPHSHSEVFVMRARHKGRCGQGPVTGLVHLVGCLARRTGLPFARICASYAALSPSSRFGARILTEPPALSTAATADLEAPYTSKLSLALISPLPRSRTPSLTRRSTPARTSAATSTTSLGSSLPASIAAWTRPRFTSLSFLAKMLLKPRLGRRRCSGIWPPSKPLMRTPERAVWPLPPRPPVLPEPEPMPRPMRWRGLREPGRSASSLSFIALSYYSLFRHARAKSFEERRRFARLGAGIHVFVDFRDVDARHKAGHDGELLRVHHAHQVRDLVDHAAHRRRVLELGDASDAVEAQADQRLALRVMPPRCASGLLDLDGFRRFRHGALPQSSSLSALNPPPPRRRRLRGGAPAGRTP